jgi:hypothetical protein
MAFKTRTPVDPIMEKLDRLNREVTTVFIHDTGIINFQGFKLRPRTRLDITFRYEGSGIFTIDLEFFLPIAKFKGKKNFDDMVYSAWTTVIRLSPWVDYVDYRVSGHFLQLRFKEAVPKKKRNHKGGSDATNTK